MRSVSRLRVVRGTPVDARSPPAATAAPGDLLLLAALLGLDLMPVAGVLLGIGRWSPAVAGFAAGAVLLIGRELWWEIRALVRARR